MTRVEVVAKDEAGALRAIVDHVGDRVADALSVSSLESTVDGFVVTVLGPVVDLHLLTEPVLQ